MRSFFLIGALTLAASTAAAQGADGKALYDQHCKKCHGATGKPSDGIKKMNPKIETFDAAFFAKRADADLVGLCLDTGHWHYAGGDAIKAVKEYGERVRYLHLKDCDPSIRDLAINERMDYFAAVAAGVFCELGWGGVDFPTLIAEMGALGYNGWAIVEQDILTDDADTPRQSARRNREYLRTLGL